MATYAVHKTTPATAYTILSNLDTMKEAREYLREVLEEHKADYRTYNKRGIREYCHWINRHQIVVHKLNDNNQPGDRVVYTALRQYHL